jgi:hypothetical protein
MSATDIFNTSSASANETAGVPNVEPTFILRNKRNSRLLTYKELDCDTLKNINIKTTNIKKAADKRMVIKT